MDLRDPRLQTREKQTREEILEILQCAIEEMDRYAHPTSGPSIGAMIVVSNVIRAIIKEQR